VTMTKSAALPNGWEILKMWWESWQNRREEGLTADLRGRSAGTGRGTEQESQLACLLCGGCAADLVVFGALTLAQKLS